MIRNENEYVPDAGNEYVPDVVVVDEAPREEEKIDPDAAYDVTLRPWAYACWGLMTFGVCCFVGRTRRLRVENDKLFYSQHCGLCVLCLGRRSLEIDVNKIDSVCVLVDKRSSHSYEQLTCAAIKYRDSASDELLEQKIYDHAPYSKAFSFAQKLNKVLFEARGNKKSLIVDMTYKAPWPPAAYFTSGNHHHH